MMLTEDHSYIQRDDNMVFNTMSMISGNHLHELSEETEHCDSDSDRE